MVSRIGHLVMHPVISRNSRNPVSFLPTAFDQLFWIICIYCSASYCQSQNARYLIWFCIFGALGFFDKIQHCFLFAGMLTSSLIFRRDIFLKKSLWIGLLIFLVLITPNLCWQIKNQFPAITHFSQLYDSQLNRLSMGGELKKLFLFSNPFTMIFWLPGLFAIPFISKFKRYKLISFALCCSFVFLFCAKGKWYYFFPCRNRSDSVRHGLFRAIIAEKKMDNLRIPHRTRINRRLPLASRNPYYQAPEIYRTIP